MPDVVRRSSLQSLHFGVTIVFSAFLLFLIQPLVSKLILPWFGGSSAVWITCLLFFQAALLLGYLYAHVLTLLPAKRQGLIHAGLLIASLLTLPIFPNARWQPMPGQDPTWLVFGALATSIGLPFLLLSATSPLLQSWYANAPRRTLPYRYFALSNAGSLAALLCYPVLIEPDLTSHGQVWIWSFAFVVFVAFCVGAAVLTLRRRTGWPHGQLEPGLKPARAQVALWISLAATGSALLIAVTNLLTQNIAPMPLLWILPLSIYLLTFILSFESNLWYKRIVFLPLVLPALGFLAAATGRLENAKIALMLPLANVALFICCISCHGELARSKPAASQLTAFYLCVAAGGALGGLFVALFSPHFFNAGYEYPIVLVACAAVLLVVLWRQRPGWKKPRVARVLWLGALALSVALAGFATQQIQQDLRGAILLKRSFYGPLRVNEFLANRSRIRQLNHGTITHGIQFRGAILRNVPTTYYGRESGIGRAWAALERTGPLRVGIVGLGAGTLAAYGRAGDTLRFYEINPRVVDIATHQFTFIRDSPAHIDIVPGDARLSMARESNQQFDILVIDAFSGDAIPVHLLTREAFRLYWHHLKPDGVLAVHVSNRYLNLPPVVLLGARDFAKQAWEVDSEDDDALQIYSATYVLVTSRPNFFNDTALKSQLVKIDVPPHLRVWTDDYSNLWQVLTFR